jgi:hypothetical protein
VRTLVALMIPLLCGCGPTVQTDMTNSDVVLLVAPVPATAGDSVTLTLENGLAQPIGYNLCTSGLERQDGEDWQPVPSDRVCTMELRLLEPGERASFTLQLQPELTGGVYRFRTNVERMEAGESDVAQTGPFRVEPS